MKLRRITVYAGSADGLADVYLQAARRLGAEIATRGCELVYGAGKTGLMGAVADGALEHGGRVIGLINDSLNLPTLVHAGLSAVETFPNIQARKKALSDAGDALIALPGGFGTFDELFEQLTWAQIGELHKPIGLLNIRGYFDPFLSLVDHAIEESFVYPEHRKLFCVATDPGVLLPMLEDYTPPQNLERWVQR